MPVLSSEQLMQKFRREVGDPLEGVSAAEPDSENLWKNVEVYGYMNEAQHRWAEVTHAIQKVFSLTVPVGGQHIKLPSTLLDVRFVQLASNSRFLDEKNLNEMTSNLRDYGHNASGYGPTILATYTGLPTYYSLDVLSGYISLNGLVETEDSLNIYASARPRVDIDDQGILESTDPADHRLILLGMKALAYSKQDSDGYDAQKAANYEQAFEEGLRLRSAAFRQKRRRAGVVRYCD